MTGIRRRYLGSLIGVTCGLAASLAIVGLIESFGNDDPFGRPTKDGPSRETATAPATEARREAAVMSLHDLPRAVPELRFNDGDGQPVSLTDFQGKIVLLNIWATWCVPCREEMPTLDRLQAELGGPDFQVVALSIDRAGLGVVSTFYDESGIEHLAKHIDESGKAARQLNTVGLPTTLLIGREGREIARRVGPAEWDAPEMVAFFQRHLGRTSRALWPDPAGNGPHARATVSAVPSAPHHNGRAARLPASGHYASSAKTKGHSS